MKVDRKIISRIAVAAVIFISASMPGGAAAQRCDFIVQIASMEELPASSSPGDAVRVGWELLDVNNCGWPEGLHLVFVEGERMSGPADVSLPHPDRGELLRVRFDVQAPEGEGEHTGIWRLALEGRAFGPRLVVELVVAGPGEPIGGQEGQAGGDLVGGVIPETYMVTASEATIIESGETGTSTVFCPDGVVTGGGWLLTGAALGAKVYLSWKTDESEGWVVSARFPANLQVGGPPATLRARVICLKNTPGETFTTFNLLNAGAEELVSGSTACPGGSLLTGGGFYLPEGLQLRSNGPSAGVNEWELTVYNESAAGKSAIHRAICLTGVQASNSMASSDYVDVMPQAEGNIPGYAVASCPVGSLVSSGGLGITGFNYYGSGMAGSGGWIVSALNPFISANTLVARATCLSFQ